MCIFSSFEELAQFMTLIVSCVSPQWLAQRLGVKSNKRDFPILKDVNGVLKPVSKPPIQFHFVFKSCFTIERESSFFRVIC
jgi:hypothetical protein